MTSILEKLEQDFETMESTLAGSKKIEYDEVLPVVEKMQHPLGEWRINNTLLCTML